MTVAARGRKWLAEALFENLLLKVVSLLAALLFYAYLHGAQNAQRVFSVSVVTLLPEDDGRVLVVDTPATVRITLSGSQPILDELRSDDLGSAQLDLRKSSGSFALFDLSQLKVPAGLKVEVDPPGIALLWDAVVTRPIPVQIPISGQPARGFSVQGQPVAEPLVAEARGPMNLVETIQLVRTEPFDVSGLAEGVYRRKLQFEVLPGRIQFLERSVLAAVTVGRARLERSYSRLPVLPTGVPKASVTPSEVDVRVAGPLELVEALRPEQIVATADVRVAAADPKKPGSVLVPVVVSIDGCTVQVVPPSVVVKW